MQGELSLCDTPPACIYSTRNYLSHLDIPCWYFSIRPSYLPSAMSWTSWSARLSSLVKNSFLIRSEATILHLCLGASLPYCLKKEDGGTDGDVEGI